MICDCSFNVWSSSSLTLIDNVDNSSTAAFNSAWAFGALLLYLIMLIFQSFNIHKHIVIASAVQSLFGWVRHYRRGSRWDGRGGRVYRFCVDWIMCRYRRHHHMQMICWDETLGSVVEARFVPVAIDLAHQGQLIILHCSFWNFCYQLINWRTCSNDTCLFDFFLKPYFATAFPYCKT